MKILILANTFQGLAGGEVIAVEATRVWSKENKVVIATTDKGRVFAMSRSIGKENILTWVPSSFDHFGIYISSFVETILTAQKAIFFDFKKFDVIFAASIFWPDVFPSVIAKIKNPRIKLIVGNYIIFPNPVQGQYNGSFVKALILHFSQRLSFILLDRKVDLVLTASPSDVPYFLNIRKLNPNSVVAVRGGVDFETISRVPAQKKNIDLVYLGRFHPQKGLFTLLSVIKTLIKTKPNLRVALVGGGPLENDLKEKVSSIRLSSHVTFYPPLDGTPKYQLLKSAKIFVSASEFDTGNIALDESLACGTPGIVFDLPLINYPQGVIKVESGNRREMAKKIIELLEDQKLRNKLGSEGKEFIKAYNWPKTAERILGPIKKRLQ